MQAVILAGGRGTRLGKLGQTTPKLLLPLNNGLLLDHIVKHLKKNGCDNIIICTGYLDKQIRQYIDQKKFRVPIKLSMERKPLGTAGALHKVKDFLEDEFFLLYGDIYIAINLKKMFLFHKRKRGDATLALHKSDHPQDSTVVKIDNDQKIISFQEKPGDNWKRYGNLTNIALYILRKDVINFIPKDREIDFAKDIFPKILKKNVKMFGYVTKDYAKDIGTLERYKEVMNLFKK